MSVAFILGLPLIASALILLPLKQYWAGVITVVSSLLVLVLAVRIALLVSSGNIVTSVLGIGLLKWVSVDGLSGLILLLVAFIGTTAAIYSVGYMAHGNFQPRKIRIYYINFNLFVFSMLAIPILAEPTLVWISVALTTLTSALIVSFEDTREALEAAWKYVVLSLMGAGIALFGFLLLFSALQASGSGASFTWSGLIQAAPGMPPVLLQIAFLLILIGLGTKVGLVPMHTWLPDAHSQAPSPVCALLSGIETSAILYVILRLFPIMQSTPDAHATTWAIVLGLISAGTAAFLLLQVGDYKRMFAFSTVEHMGIILTSVGIGAAGADYAALHQIISHSVTKSFCFFAAGAVFLNLGTRKIASVRGLIRRSPFTAAALVFGGLAITGAPPLAVFISEFSILKAGLSQADYVAMGLLSLFILIAFFGIMLKINQMVFSPPENDTLSIPPDGNPDDNRFHLHLTCRLAMIMAAVPVLVLGLYIPQPLQDLLTQATAALTR